MPPQPTLTVGQTRDTCTQRLFSREGAGVRGANVDHVMMLTGGRVLRLLSHRDHRVTMLMVTGLAAEPLV